MLTNIGYKWYYRVWKYDCFVDLVPVPYKLKNHSIQLQQKHKKLRKIDISKKFMVLNLK